MARTASRKNPLEVLRDVLENPTARRIAGQLSPEDLNVLARSHGAGELRWVFSSLIRSPDHRALASSMDHPAAQVIAKIDRRNFRALVAACPPEGCPP